MAGDSIRTLGHPVIDPVCRRHAHSTETLNHPQALERFLAGVERRAFRMAELATGSREDALDIVQDAMYKLVRHYGSRGVDEWGPLFQRILQSAIRDWYQLSYIRNRVRVWLWGADGEDDVENSLESLADPNTPTPERRRPGQQGADTRALPAVWRAATGSPGAVTATL